MIVKVQGTLVGQPSVLIYNEDKSIMEEIHGTKRIETIYKYLTKDAPLDLKAFYSATVKNGVIKVDFDHPKEYFESPE
jgi:hypothetical protein